MQIFEVVFLHSSFFSVCWCFCTSCRKYYVKSELENNANRKEVSELLSFSPKNWYIANSRCAACQIYTQTTKAPNVCIVKSSKKFCIKVAILIFQVWLCVCRLQCVPPMALYIYACVCVRSVSQPLAVCVLFSSFFCSTFTKTTHVRIHFIYSYYSLTVYSCIPKGVAERPSIATTSAVLS